MERVFISKLAIDKVRRLRNIAIPLSANQLKHLILTGRNGSEKTSLLEAMADELSILTVSHSISVAEERTAPEDRDICAKLKLDFNCPLDSLRNRFASGEFIIAYYKALRSFSANPVKHIESVDLKEVYAISEEPRAEFVRYLADLRFRQLNAKEEGDLETSEKIRGWFEKLEELLKDIFEDPSLKLVFNAAEHSYNFQIVANGKEPFGFTELSSGYGAVLDIAADLLLRMERKTKQSFDFVVPGIVLIDEIESHLHVEMQKKVMPLLTALFPNIQFIVTAYSPFVLNSLENTAIYDLETKMLVENGLADIPYSGIVEGYFHTNELSASLQRKFTRYKELVKGQSLTDDDLEEISRLEMYLDKIPEHLALNITPEYRKLKLGFESKGDICW